MDNYEESYNELRRIQKHIGSSSITIDFKKLDGETQNEIRSAIMNVVSKRHQEVSQNIQRSNSSNNWMQF